LVVVIRLQQIKGLQRRRRYWPNFRLKIECNLKEDEIKLHILHN
jgi:hypothetical protein